jgi:hypothetical protein
VPESSNTPHLHSSGRVFRRRGDKSDPVEVTNRVELDELYGRSRRLRKRLEKHLDRGFDERWARNFDMPWVHCALVPSLDNSAKASLVEFDTFRSLVTGPGDGLVLPDTYASSIGYLARNHSQQQVPDGPATTFEFALNGRVYLTLPLSVGDMADRASLSFLRNPLGQRFQELLIQRGMQDTSVIDGSYLVASFLGLHSRARAVLSAAGLSGRYVYRVRCRNFFRRVPYFGAATYINWCHSGATPVLHRARFRLPERAWGEIDDIHEKYALAGAAGQVLMSLGVPQELVSPIVTETLSAVHGNAPA